MMMPAKRRVIDWIIHSMQQFFLLNLNEIHLIGAFWVLKRQPRMSIKTLDSKGDVLSSSTKGLLENDGPCYSVATPFCFGELLKKTILGYKSLLKSWSVIDTVTVLP